MSQGDVAAPQTTNLVNPVDGPFVRFPPFPQPPDGVHIMSFSDFKERGICVEPGPDDAEVDALGIPTIPIRARHSTDVCKTNTKRKRKAEEAKARKKGGPGVKKISWWEQWEDTEAIRFSIGFDPNTSRFERIHAAAADFTSGRTWPVHYASESGPKFIWEKFQRYIGLSEGPLPGEKKKKGGKQDDVDEENISDDEIEELEDSSAGASVGSMSGILLDRELPVKLQMATNEDKLLAFFNSPEKSINIFLSSYARTMGFIWADANLECMGRVLGFFVNFLLRSKVLPEAERSLRRSLDFITKSIKELPSTAALAKVIPDTFSLACNACWGRKSEGYTVLSLDIETNVPAARDPEPVAVTEEVKADDAPPAEDAPAWSNSSWGTTEAGGWERPANDTADDPNNVWGSYLIPESAQEDVAAAWQTTKQENLLSLLGPTALPLTHTTGIIERSMRRIKSIIPPSSNPPKSPPLPDGATEPDADAVEVELGRQFTKVVLEPMIDWDAGESPVYARPTIIAAAPEMVAEPTAPQPTEGTPGPKPYDPFRDEITLLIETVPDRVELLSEGMGLGGTWVQIVRQGEPVKKKKKGKSKKVIPSFWYLDELAVITPSFWAIKS